MNSRKQLAVLLLMLVCTGRTDALGFSFFYDWFNTFTAPNEGCNGDWISFDERGLKDDLKSRLYGQHIASEVILNAVAGSMNNDNPQKPLVLSLHGTTGTGKNLASQLIVKNIYKKGMDSRFVHFFSAVLHFRHVDQVETYKSQLQHWIRGNVTNCAHSIFIFDEMEKMHPGLIDCIKPFMDYHHKLDGVSYRKAIFIFLSNAGGDVITQTTLDSWKAGKKREELKLKDVERALSLFLFNDKNGGLWNSGLIESSLVDFFIPFLPLERRHVVQCVLAEIKARGIPLDRDEACLIANEVYYHMDEKLFSVSGCKTISTRMQNYIANLEVTDLKLPTDIGPD